MNKLFTILTIVALGLSTTLTHAQEKKVVVKETVHTKKDGTPDKRFKENKTVIVHTKKDGTPDMRYKENKTVAKDNKTVVKKKVVVKKK